MALVVHQQQPALARHHFRESHAARCCAVLTHQPSDAAAERIADDADGRGETTERGEPVRMRGGDDLAPLGTRLDARRAAATPVSGGRDPHGGHVGKVQQQRSVRRQRMSMSATLYRDRQIVLARKHNRWRHICGTQREHDDGRLLFERRHIPCLPRGIVAIVVRHERRGLGSDSAGLEAESMRTLLVE